MFRRSIFRLCAVPPTSSLAPTPGKVRVKFITPEKKVVEVYSPIGAILMEVARDIGKVDIEAACDGTCACSTCHVYLDKTSYAKLPPPSEDELDMLDLAPEPRPTSRLSCQVKLSEQLDGIEATLPAEQSNQLN